MIDKTCRNCIYSINDGVQEYCKLIRYSGVGFTYADLIGGCHHYHMSQSNFSINIEFDGDKLFISSENSSGCVYTPRTKIELFRYILVYINEYHGDDINRLCHKEEGRKRMIKFENTEVIGWEHAIRGMRNPMNSWGKSDSKWSYNNPGQLHTCNRIARFIRRYLEAAFRKESIKDVGEKSE